MPKTTGHSILFYKDESIPILLMKSRRTLAPGACCPVPKAAFFIRRNTPNLLAGSHPLGLRKTKPGAQQHGAKYLNF